jgi:hypothetical protein
MSKARRLLAIALLALLAPAAASAQATFYAAYEQGLEHEGQGRWREAREAFLTAAELRPEPAQRAKTYGVNFLHDYDPYLHLARAELALGLLDEAEAHIARSAAAGVSPQAAIDELEQQLQSLRRAAARPTATAIPQRPEPAPTAAPRAPTAAPTTVVLSSSPAGADVFIDGRLEGITPVTLDITPGQHQLMVRAEGFRPSQQSFNIAAGESSPIHVVLEREAVPTVAVAAAQPPAAAATRPPAPVATATTPSRIVAASAQPTEPATPTRAATELPEAIADQVPDSGREAAAGHGRLWLVVVGVVVLAGLAALGLIWRRNRVTQRYDTDVTVAAELTPTVHLQHSSPLPENVNPSFDGYRLMMVLGRGGMATTYLAERVSDNRSVAIKIPHEHLLANQELVRRFVREGSFGATIHHPNIIRIYEASTVKGKPFIAMELLDGVTLEQKIAAEGALPVVEALEIARSIAQALDYAHMKNVIHRDLKPENVMVLRDGTIKVMDYGIARIIDTPGLTATNTYLGTPLYSAPESITPADVDGQSDLYSLGIILYRILSNRLPFHSTSPLELLEMHRSKPLPELPKELQIPHEVDVMVRRLAAKTKQDRYRTAEAFLKDVNAYLHSCGAGGTSV